MPEWELKWPWHKIKSDSQVREDFLQESLPFIRHVAHQVTHRYLEWGRDEELSEALIAFNEAVEHYDDERSVPFLAFARVLIKRRLIDFFRRQKHNDALSFEEEAGQGAEINISLGEFSEQEQNKERVLEIQEFSQKLLEYQLSFNDLAKASPKHRDTRETLLRVACHLARDSELWQQVLTKRKLPMQALVMQTQVHPKVLERGRKYILAVALLIAHEYDFIYLREYVLTKERRERG